ncbi:hypothetical protein COX86_00935 [Candidatus Micrarchaeota archaeon CG_4_10_14_0_2_um_filter_60_11]|nr:MAG: hypothetical protein COX86_00935 [Candidatus Micrarchaeota archaeon CG_4_10_14_0_2_um_filter_60_11]
MNRALNKQEREKISRYVEALRLTHTETSAIENALDWYITHKNVDTAIVEIQKSITELREKKSTLPYELEDRNAALNALKNIKEFEENPSHWALQCHKPLHPYKPPHEPE